MTSSRIRSRRRRGVRLKVENRPLAEGRGQSALVGAPSLLHIGQRPGDPIEIQGTEITYARVEHSDPDDWHSGRIYMDEVLRKNAGVELGESVTIEPARIEPASDVRLRYRAGASEPRADGALPEIRSTLCDRAIFTGDVIPLFAISPSDPPCVEISDVQPDAAGRIRPDTSFTFESVR
ncbi:hypothetical protein BV210_19000 (plasmid) [Halorientalis sp. IM1011]|uniref:hypothetical protein n=1 Tax=Halorientalis sp. IM1011 TaxID=1932360 RepID=UPI00097CD0D8|nr:hypothetical protein [Halorientalis sp. IM1011]AQL44854.1 hypothetical protein BV210_19000 [Halorientalis sp. IM1011]